MGSKSDPLVEEVELLDANSSFSHVHFANGQELTISTEDLAPNQSTIPKLQMSDKPSLLTLNLKRENYQNGDPCTNNSESLLNHASNSSPTLPEPVTPPIEPTTLRHSTRTCKAPRRYGNYICNS